MDRNAIYQWPIPHIFTRYYQEPGKSLEQCRSHGRDHAAYKWSPQIDPRWSDEQIAAYRDGYENYKAAA